MPCGCQSACGCNVQAGAGIIVQRIGDTFVVSSAVTISVEDTDCIDMTYADGVISASPVLAPGGGLECGPDGLSISEVPAEDIRFLTIARWRSNA